MSHCRRFTSIILIFALAFAALLPTFSQEAQAADDITIYVNGQLLVTDQPAVSYQGRTLVPLRSIFTALGANVEWYKETRTIVGYDPQTNTILSLILDSKNMWKANYSDWQKYESNPTSPEAINFVQSTTSQIDVAPMSIGGRTMVPVRVISEALGADVEWNGATRTITVDR
ncbi:MAG: copper amine oxidase N-terminal domain-containing protein [Peptococcaceae bacterium]|nr:copper amine oxidase N-terminal domain-containing protein [Peptococcaceae bacterium]